MEMKLIINGVEFVNPSSVVIEVDPDGETVGPWDIEFRGGPLTVRGEKGSALTIRSTAQPAIAPYLILSNGSDPATAGFRFPYG